MKVVPEPGWWFRPGFVVRVQLPDAGSPLNGALPVVSPQAGWVMVPTVGAVGMTGGVLITAGVEDPEIHPAALVTVHV